LYHSQLEFNCHHVGIGTFYTFGSYATELHVQRNLFEVITFAHRQINGHTEHYCIHQMSCVFNSKTLQRVRSICAVKSGLKGDEEVYRIVIVVVKSSHV